MKHFIIVKFKKDYNYKDEINNIKDLFNKAMIIPEIKDISLDNYTCFAIEDLDGNKIEISYYDI